MLPDFNSLLEKLRQLVELSHVLRAENAELRGELAKLAADNAQLAQRMNEARDRVSRLIAALPADAAASADTTTNINREAA